MVVGYTTLSHMQPLNYCNSTLNTSGIILILLDSSEKRSKELISLEDGYVKRKNQVKFNNNNPLWIWAQNLWWTTMHISVGWRTVIKIGQYLFLEKKKKEFIHLLGLSIQQAPVSSNFVTGLKINYLWKILEPEDFLKSCLNHGKMLWFY